MKKHLLHRLRLCLAVAVVLCFTGGAWAEVEWNTQKDVDLGETPLDLAVSRDGLTAFILCEKSVKLYSIYEGRVTDSIPISDGFSRIALSPDGETLLLTDTEKKQLTVVRVTPVYDIEISRSPVMGKVDVPVTVVAFVDYQ